MNQQNSFELSQQDSTDALSRDSLPQYIEAKIQGEISGQVAVGSHILQIGSVHGGVVNITSAEEQRPQSRALPVLLRPRPFPNLIGREVEVEAAIKVLQAFVPLEFYGDAGVGKTCILRYLAHRHETTLLFPDGIIYLTARFKPLSDLLQALFDAFYDSNTSIKPTDTQIRHALQDKRALILLDDSKLTRGELEDLMNAAPNCTVLLSSQNQHLWGEGKSIALQGLPAEKAISLLENDLGRSLETNEKLAAQELCSILNGHPLKLLQSLALVKQEISSLVEIVHQYQLKNESEQSSGINEVTATSTAEERSVLAVLATLGGVGLSVQQVATITELTETTQILQTLQQRNLVQLDGDRYSLDRSLAEALERTWDLSPWFQKSLNYFTNLAEQCKTVSNRILKETDAFLYLLTKAATAGLWAEVLKLSQLTEGAFALNKYWGAWENALQMGLQAARNLQHQASEALMLHQLGTRAVCLDDRNTARSFLDQAIQIRESLGDKIGAAISRHNLGILLAVIAASAAVGTIATTVSSGMAGTTGATTGVGATVTGMTSTAGVGTTVTALGIPTLAKVGAAVAVLTGATVIAVKTFTPGNSAPPISTPTTQPVQSPAVPSNSTQPSTLSPSPTSVESIEPRPSPTPVEPRPSPTPVEPRPSPTPVEPSPSPTPVEPSPSPTPVEPSPSPTPVEPSPSPTPVEPIEPSPSPTPVEPSNPNCIWTKC